MEFIVAEVSPVRFNRLHSRSLPRFTLFASGLENVLAVSARYLRQTIRPKVKRSQFAVLIFDRDERLTYGEHLQRDAGFKSEKRRSIWDEFRRHSRRLGKGAYELHRGMRNGDKLTDLEVFKGDQARGLGECGHGNTVLYVNRPANILDWLKSMLQRDRRLANYTEVLSQESRSGFTPLCVWSGACGSCTDRIAAIPLQTGAIRPARKDRRLSQLGCAMWLRCRSASQRMRDRCLLRSIRSVSCVLDVASHGNHG